MEQSVSREETGAVRAAMVTRERVALALLFMMNGYVFGSWALKIPEFAARLGFDSAAMGMMILVFGIGSLVFMPITGILSAQFGSGVVSRMSALLLTPALLFITFAPGTLTAIAVMLYFGGTIAAMDVAINANAVAVEKNMRRAIMSSCHAFWSLGGLIGSATGGLLIAYWGPAAHAVVVTIFVIILLVLAWRKVEPDTAHHQADQKQKFEWPRTPLPWLVGVIALFSMIPEGAILDWSAYYLRDGLGAEVTVASMGFAAFSMTMAIMRFAGDIVRDRLGAVQTLRICTAVAIIGLLIVGAASNPYIAIIGFAVCGLGISNMVPIAFSIAGSIPGVNPSVGLSIATTLGYSGMLVAPSLIGIIARSSGFSIIFLSLPVLLLVVLAFSSLARYADQNH